MDLGAGLSGESADSMVEMHEEQWRFGTRTVVIVVGVAIPSGDLDKASWNGPSR